MRSTQASMRKHQRPHASTLNEPSHQSLPTGVSGDSAPLGRAARLPAHRGAERLVPVAEDPRAHVDAVADRALDRVAAAVDLRGHVLDLDAGGRPLRPRGGHGHVFLSGETAKLNRGDATALERRPAASHLAPGRPARRRGVPVRRLAGGGGRSPGGRSCRSRRPTSTARRTSARRRSRPGAGSWPSRAHPCRADEIESFVARHPFWIGDWAAFAGGGAIADQVRFEREWGALRAYAAERGVRADRRRADLRRAGRRRPPVPSRALPGGRRGGRPAGRVHAATASSGATRSTTGPRTGRPASAGGSSASGARSSSSTSRGSTISAGSSPTGPCRPARKTARAAAGAGAGPRAASRRSPRARRAAADRRGPRGDHAAPWTGCATTSACPGWSSCTGRSAAAATNPHALANHRENQVVYTATHDNDTTAGWFRSLPKARAGADGPRPARAELGGARARLARARRWRSRRRRTCSGSAARRG